MSTATLPMYRWDDLPWKKFRKVVWKLQKRIYQAMLRGDVKLVRKLQKLLMKSRAAKFLAVRRVAQENSGKKTAGVDGVKSLTPQSTTTDGPLSRNLLQSASGSSSPDREVRLR